MTTANFSWAPGIIVSVILAVLIGGIASLFLESSAPFMPIVIVGTPLFLIYGVVTQNGMRNKAIGYWSTIDGYNRSMPGFSSFYEQYLTVRKQWNRAKLRNSARQAIPA
jgi:hypothetical protein